MLQKNKLRVLAVIQARMGSTRLPGKVLADIAGMPMLWHVINRLEPSELIEKVVVATSKDTKDDAIEEFCKKYNFEFFRGSEEDVLDRYYKTAAFYNADIIVRITSDCPLIDYRVVDKVIKAFIENKVGAASNTAERTFPRGLDTEVISFGALKKCWEETKNPYQREHVTPYIYEKPDLFGLFSFKNDVDLSYLRWTVDEKDDMEFVKKVYEKLYRADKVFTMDDVLVLLKDNPSIAEINKSVKQKALSR